MVAETLRRIGRWTSGVLSALALIVVSYFLAAWVGSSIPAGGEVATSAAPHDSVEIMVETNGTHTGIVVPIVSARHDWRATFPSASEPLPGGQLPTHLAIGWGEREVFLNVPTWGDLKAGTALRIATVGGESIMRVSHYYYPAASDSHRPVRISEAQYARLVAAIERTLPNLSPGAVRQVLRGSYADDAYYEARGSYTLVNNCNSWVGDVLAEAGVPMGAWTPLAGGVMKWIPAHPSERQG